jgi:Kef-type K+ transport system membrane component KefB
MRHSGGARVLVLYGLMLAAAVGLFLLIRSVGETYTAPPAPPAASAERAPAGTALIHVLLTLAAVMVVGRLIGRGFQYIGQPPVIGEVVAGIVLGPSLLGQVWPAATELLLPASAAPVLGVIAQLGVILYMFLVGLEFNPRVLRGRAHATVAISHASIVVPFIVGAALALVLYPRLSNDAVPFTGFALLLGAALSVTAFPVLARILTDRGISRTPLGVLALTCAAVDDVTAWCLLAVVVGIAKADVRGALVVFAGSAAYLAFLFVIARPLLVRMIDRAGGRLTRDLFTVILACLMLSAVATELIGIHAIFGAFVLGAIIPHDSPVARELGHKLEDLVTTLLLPAFFAFTGMRTQIGLIAGLENVLLCAAIILVATLGKFGGTVAASRLTGLGWPQAAALGALMNTRGLMELIVLNVGLEMGLISPALYAMMVLMAVATTLATSPVLKWLTPWLGDELRPLPASASDIGEGPT